MSNLNVMAEIAQMVEFIKSQTKKNLLDAKSEGKIDLNEEQLKKVCFYVEASIGNSFSRTASQIEKIVNKK